MLLDLEVMHGAI